MKLKVYYIVIISFLCCNTSVSQNVTKMDKAICILEDLLKSEDGIWGLNYISKTDINYNKLINKLEFKYVSEGNETNTSNGKHTFYSRSRINISMCLDDIDLKNIDCSIAIIKDDLYFVNIHLKCINGKCIKRDIYEEEKNQIPTSEKTYVNIVSVPIGLNDLLTRDSVDKFINAFKVILGVEHIKIEDITKK